MGWVKWVGLCVGVMLMSCGFRAGIAWVSFRCCLGFVLVSCGCCVGAIWVLCGSCVGVICPPPHHKWVGCVTLVILCPTGVLR